MWALDLSLACAGLEQSQEPRQFSRLSCLAHPKEASASPTLGLIINSRFSGLMLERTGSGEQPGSLGSQEKDGSGGGEGGKV